MGHFLHTMKILIIDDNPTFLMLFQLYAENNAQFEFVYGKSGEEALNILENEKEGNIVLLVSDVRMPLMSGIELSQIVNNRYPKIPIILITGWELSYFSKNDLISSTKLLSKDIGIDGIIEEIKLFLHVN